MIPRAAQRFGRLLIHAREDIQLLVLIAVCVHLPENALMPGVGRARTRGENNYYCMCMSQPIRHEFACCLFHNILTMMDAVRLCPSVGGCSCISVGVSSSAFHRTDLHVRKRWKDAFMNCKLITQLYYRFLARLHDAWLRHAGHGVLQGVHSALT